MAFQKMEQELEFAGRVQHSFLPTHVPQVEGWQLSAILGACPADLWRFL